MKKESQGTLEIKIRAYYSDFGELSEDTQKLFRHAVNVRKNAQAPYSNYHVGVAIMSGNWNIYSGCNVERASWTQTTHAEQNAVDSMVAAEGPSRIKALALVAAPANEEVFLRDRVEDSKHIEPGDIGVPCGHCLQIIWENCLGDARVPLMSLMANGKISLVAIGDALPFRFGPADLGVDYSKMERAL